MRVLFIAALLAASPARAGVEEAVEAHILPGLAEFASAAGTLAEAAREDCTPEALATPYNAAFDAWMAVGDIKLGPLESAAPAIAFWPDARGFTPKMLSGLIAAEDPLIGDPEAVAELSVAARGLFALDMLLFDESFSAYAPGSYSCSLARALTADLAREASELERGWEGFAAILLSAGEAGNATYLDEDEALRALYTQLLSGLEFTTDSRLGRPMGTFERPRPARAEAWRSGRSLSNVLLATEAAVAFADALADWELPKTHAALDAVQVAAAKIGDPAFQTIDDPSERFKAEVLQQKVEGVSDAIEEEIGLALGITPGFNSGDGD